MSQLIVCKGKINEMKIYRVGKESIEIELDGRTYRLSGVLADGFYVSPTEISFISDERHPIPMEERRSLAEHVAGSAPEAFVRMLRDPEVLMETCLYPVPDGEKSEIVQKIRDQWDEASSGFELHFDPHAKI